MINDNPTNHGPRQQRNQRSRQQLADIRLKAVKRVLAGESAAQVIKELGFHRSCIYQWLKLYEAEGEAGLSAKPISGRPGTNAPRKALPKLQLKPHAALVVPAKNDIDGWIRLLYQSLEAVDAPFEAFLNALNQCFKGSSIIMLDFKASTLPIRAHYQGHSLEKMIELNQATTANWPLNPLLKALQQPGDIYTLDDVVPADKRDNHPYYRLIRQRVNLSNVPTIGLCFAGPNNALSGLFIYGLVEHLVYSGPDRKLLQRLRAHLEIAVRLSANYWRGIYTAKTLEEAIDNLAIAALVLDGNGLLIDSNNTARDLLDTGKYCALQQQKVQFSHAQNREFQQAVKKAIAWRQQPIEHKPVTALRLGFSGEQTLGVLVQPITPPSMEVPHAIAMSPHVVVYISNPGKPQSNPRHRLIMKLFNLSTREAYLATLLTDGLGINEAAKKMSITQATARTYLQHIYEKTGVSRRQDLVQQVMKSVALLV